MKNAPAKFKTRQVAFLVTISLHLSVIYCLLHLRNNARRVEGHEDSSTLVVFLSQKEDTRHLKESSSIHDQLRQKVVPLQKPTGIENLAPGKSAETSVASAPNIAPAPEPDPSGIRQSGDIVGKALRDVRKIDRDIGKEHPSLADLTPLAAQSKFARAIAAAAKIHETTTETFTLDDGRVMTKVTGPAGTYCVTTDSLDSSSGLDQLQNGLRTIKIRCPK